MKLIPRFIIILSSFLMLYVSATVHAATTSNKEAIEAAAAAFKTIGTLRRETPINADAIASAYAGALQTLTQEVDTTNQLSLDSDILSAIEDIKKNNDQKLAGQVIDKTLQRVFYQTVFNRIATIREQFKEATPTALNQMTDEALVSAQALSSTAARPNHVLTTDRQSLVEGTNSGLDIAINESFERIRNTLNKNNPDEDFANFGIERYATRMSLARAYYNSVLREVAGVLNNRDRDPETTAIEQKEGEIFYRIIESLVARDNPVGNMFIKARLTGNPSEITADEMVSELNKGFIGRVKAEMKGQEDSIGRDRAQAMAEAAGTLYFANILLPDLELRLGADVRSNFENALNNLQIASSENSEPKSAEARQAISTILTNYENQLKLTKFNKTNDTSLIIDGAVSSYQAIGELRNQTPMNADAIAAEYEGDLQQLTQIVDGIYGLSMNNDILNAIEVIRSGNETALAAQAIDKTLQRVFALTVYNRITLTLDAFDSLPTDALELEWDRAYAAFLAIIGTAGRENKVLTADKLAIESGSNPDLDDQITLAFINGKEALVKNSAEDKTNLALARENIVVPLVRSFLIGVLREVEGIISERDRDINEAREKQIEGEYFYRIVEEFISQTNPSGSTRIKSQLTGDLANVSANEIVSEISKGIMGQVKNNLREIESTFQADKNQATLAAERLSLYANIFLPDLALRLGSLERVKMENALQDLKEAINQNKVDKAIDARETILSVIANYESQLI
ncbi:hypothetical protein BCL69_103018 [Nitrosomonas communis]|uniref:Uncharacterized protein n=1 Tax=Nitrosomonas communis TaxID=44574 RepID=A0A0F7KBF4_9PROT|nr:hypothetical protein AAW31_02405 [Nitrosomonas communis]TYP86638.1 hypothetical protein BCL69_103018 [Nitrosomonas communis]